MDFNITEKQQGDFIRYFLFQFDNAAPSPYLIQFVKGLNLKSRTLYKQDLANLFKLILKIEQAQIQGVGAFDQLLMNVASNLKTINQLLLKPLVDKDGKECTAEANEAALIAENDLKK